MAQTVQNVNLGSNKNKNFPLTSQTPIVFDERNTGAGEIRRCFIGN